MTATVTTLTIDARGAAVGSAEYIRAVEAAQKGVDRLANAEAKAAAAREKGGAQMVGSAATIARVSRDWDRLRSSVDRVAAAEIKAQKAIRDATLSADAAVRRGKATQEEAARVIAQVRAQHEGYITAARAAAAANDNVAVSTSRLATTLGTVAPLLNSVGAGGLADIAGGAGVGRLAAIGGGLVALAAGAITAGSAIASAGDQWTGYANRLLAAGEAASDVAQRQRALVETSLRSNTDLSATVELYSGLRRATLDLGKTQDEVARVTETVNKAFVLGGQSAGTASGAILQLNQAFASGALRGDELNSVLEGAPPLARLIAQEFGVGVGELRKLAEQGILTSDRIFAAIANGSAEIDRTFNATTRTMGQESTNAGTALLQLGADMDSLLGISQKVAKGLGLVTAAALGMSAALQEAAANGPSKQLKNLDEAVTSLEADVKWRQETFGAPGLKEAMDNLAKLKKQRDELFNSVWTSMVPPPPPAPELNDQGMIKMAGAAKAADKALKELTDRYSTVVTEGLSPLARATKVANEDLAKRNKLIDDLKAKGADQVQIERLQTEAQKIYGQEIANAQAATAKSTTRLTTEQRASSDALKDLQAVSDKFLQKEDPLEHMRQEAEKLQKMLDLVGDKLDAPSRSRVQTYIDNLNKGVDDFAERTKGKVDEIGQELSQVFGGVFDDLFTKADAGFDGMLDNITGGLAKIGTRLIERNLLGPLLGASPLGGANATPTVKLTQGSADAVGAATGDNLFAGFDALLKPTVGADGKSAGFLSSPAGAGLTAGLSGFGMGYQSQSPLMGAGGGLLSGLAAMPALGALGPLGPVLGMGLGLLGGIMGNNSAKKQQRAEAEKQYQEMLPQIGLQRQSWLGNPQGSLSQQTTQIIADRDNAAKAAYNAGRPITEWLAIIQDSQVGIARAKEEFRASFGGIVDALNHGGGPNGAYASAQQAVDDMGEGLKAFVSDAREAGMTASETAMAQAAARNAALSMLTGAEELSAVAAEMQRIDGTAAGLGQVLRDLGMSADEAAKAVSDGVTAAMDKLRTSFSDDLTSRLNDAQGNGYLNDISELVKRRQTDLADAQSLGIDPALVDKVFSAEAQKVVDGAELAGDALVELVARFPELQGAVTDFLQAADPSRLLGYQDRLFAAQTDQTTLEGQLAMLGRQFQREREAEAERGGAYMVDLELAQAQERANVVREWGQKVKEEERARYQENLDFLAGQRRRVSEWVDAQSQGSASPLSPGAQLAAAEQQFDRQYALVQSGDRDAYSSITEYASRVQEAARAQYASGEGYQAIYDRLMARMRDLGDIAPEDEFASVIAAINSLLPKFDSLDTSLDGLLSYDEFKEGMSGSESELKKIYKEIDENGDGFISKLEMLRIATLSIIPKFDTLDTSLDGLLSFEEFKKGMPGSETLLRQIFTELDINGDGHLAKLELIRAAAVVLAPKFDVLDTSLNGLLSFDEFKKGMSGSEDTLKSIFTELDTNGDAQLSELELVRGKIESLLPEFATLDTSVNGLLSYDEFKKGMKGSEDSLKKIFTELDTNHDGELDALELINGSLLSILPKFDTLDTSVDGVLTFDEFKAGMAGSEATLSSIFTTIDANGDSQITKLEAIRAATKGLPTSFKTLDTSVNGLLSYDEFKKGMKGSEDSLKEIFDTLDLDGDAQLSEMELAREKIEALLPQFTTLDTSINGLLDFTEFTKGMKGSEDSLKKIFTELDTNHDGELDALELINGSVKSLVKKFDDLDLDSSGGLSYTEFTKGMAGSEATLKSIFKELDGNGNGQLEKLELIKSYSFGTLDAAGNQSDILEDIAKIQDAANSLNRNANTFLDSIDRLQGTLVQISKDQKIFMWAVSANTASIANFTAGDGGAYGIVIRKPQEAIDNGYAAGGWISGPGTGTSDTAGRFALSDGEFVVREAIASKNRWLEDFNRTGEMPMRAVPVMAPMPVYAAANTNGPSYAELVAEVRALRQELARNTAVTSSGSEAVRRETAGTRAETAGLREDARTARRTASTPVGRGQKVA